jgi:3'-phosphoadenosine 5'-phosphosulfate sulfotransferase (PAPS reductase)/FAD synthetase
MFKLLLQLIRDPKCVFISNHSGGKDSQIMWIRLQKIIPKHRLIVIHAHLPIIEWEGTEDFIRATVDSEIHIVQANKTFFEMVEHRNMFPSPQNRQCTSDLKRGPIAKKIREICNTHGYNKVVNCMGLRAQESDSRKKKDPFKINITQTNKKRTWYEWLPIHKMLQPDVFSGIEKHGQKPFWVYSAGMERKSCKICIFSTDSDVCTAARLSPEIVDIIDYWEEKTGHVMMMPSKTKGRRTIKQIISSQQQ